MPKSRKLEETLSILAQIRAHPTSEEGIIILRQVLKSKYSIAVAQAAKIVGESTITELVGDLVEAFARMMETVFLRSHEGGHFVSSLSLSNSYYFIFCCCDRLRRVLAPSLNWEHPQT
ncbi:MAG: hypothetical protein HWQ35_23565 [Nostoc sp. NMS1]|uniref:hypothetical protein n=1 Tax=unclassified Nostoc TaxID=2593658 RepID=UPI0025FA4752|nr:MULTISPECIES: hypothetical protein [unclassified Nostoc]MBN3909414.1 hypothetical protein [Nostoc sp. NMS1]MBN3991682.1 hypothetical protein [Nostoc sp. NMS2]